MVKQITLCLQDSLGLKSRHVACETYILGIHLSCPLALFVPMMPIVA